jgi:hypothetical protein
MDFDRVPKVRQLNCDISGIGVVEIAIITMACYRSRASNCHAIPTPANEMPVKSAISFFHVVMSSALN